MSWVKNLVRFALVTVGVIALTTLGIDATQYFEGSGSALSILTQEALEEGCPEGMVLMEGSSSRLCVDMYEVSIGAECPAQTITIAADTAANVNTPNCVPESEAEEQPWTYVTYHQAAALCAKAGKRLPTHLEWYTAALGTPDDGSYCNINGSLSTSGDSEQCRSGIGTFDQIGNVWEWVQGEVTNGIYENRQLPPEGYVQNTGADGVALETGETANISFNKDYFWSRASGTAMFMRGGFYGSGSDAGVFTVHADVDGDFSGQAIGFRCVKDL